MSCCHCAQANAVFDRKKAQGDLDRYRKRGPDSTTRHLIDAVRGRNLRGVSLLDVGAGIGVLHHELLGETVGGVTHVEESSAYVTAAKGETERRGHTGMVEFRVGDFVTLAPELPEADVVTLDRVVCCYPDMKELLTASATKARQFVGLSYPRDRWYVRAMIGLENWVRRLRGQAFRVFVHSPAEITATLRAQGMQPMTARTTPVWEIALFMRRPTTA